jgi:hypothetical protein
MAWECGNSDHRPRHNGDGQMAWECGAGRAKEEHHVWTTSTSNCYAHERALGALDPVVHVRASAALVAFGGVLPLLPNMPNTISNTNQVSLRIGVQAAWVRGVQGGRANAANASRMLFKQVMYISIKMPIQADNVHQHQDAHSSR